MRGESEDASLAGNNRGLSHIIGLSPIIPIIRFCPCPLLFVFILAFDPLPAFVKTHSFMARSTSVHQLTRR